MAGGSGGGTLFMMVNTASAQLMSMCVPDSPERSGEIGCSTINRCRRASTGRSGGLRYRATTSCTFSLNAGLADLERALDAGLHIVGAQDLVNDMGA